MIVKRDEYNYFLGYEHLAAGLCCGFSSLVKKQKNN